MKYCSNCGSKLNEGAKFCNECGTKIEEKVDSTTTLQKVELNQISEIKENKEKRNNIIEGEIHKCPNCGELLSSLVVVCPSCGYEIRERKTASSILGFFEQVSKVEDEDKKIEMIKLYPIPNTKEDILEFMLLASSNYDVKYYVSNKNRDTIAGAWLSKIEQCYKKANMLFDNSKELETINKLYFDITSKTKKTKKQKLILTIIGISLIILSVILMYSLDESAFGVIPLAVGIILLVFAGKKKKTNKEIEYERQKKLKELEIKANKSKK